MAVRVHHPASRHASAPQRTNRVATAVLSVVAWMLADHDDRVPNRIQTVVWFVALLVVFFCTLRTS